MRHVFRHLRFLGVVVVCLIGTKWTYGQNKASIPFQNLHGAQAKVLKQQRSIPLQNLHGVEAKVLKPQGVATVSAAATKVTINRGEMLFERVDQQPVAIKEAGGVSRNELPFHIYGVKPDGKDLNLVVVVDVDGGGMRPTPNAGGFVGTLRFGIIDKQSPNSQETLPTPVNFQVTADVDRVTPGAVSLKHTNLPFAPLTLFAASPGDRVAVQIRPSFSITKPVKVDLSVIRPELSIQISPRDIQGWGLEEAEITIEAPGMEQPENTEVRLSTTKGALDRSIVRLDKGGVGTAKIRSIGLGLAKVTAGSSRLKGADGKIQFTLPWAFGIATLLGAAIGVVAKKFGSKSKGKRLTMTGLISGVALGILGAVAFAVGVNLTGYVPEAKVGEAVTFFVAGIVAYAGGFAQKISNTSSN